MRELLAVGVVGVLIGFGGGYVVNDQTSGDRTVTVQHKRDPRPRLGSPTGPLTLGGNSGSRCDFAGFC